ncbi:MAG TPA: hypothetical protein PK987_08530 [Ferruginibacter sp.]|nr:hypothetical protein [Ferruginibacter sp.]
MKHYAPYALSLLLCVISTTGFSQDNTAKPKQFSSFPTVIDCSQTELSRIFTAPQGQYINLQFASNFNFSGTVTSNIVKYANLQSAIIKSPDFSNTIFSVSKILNEDGTVSFTGRIINKNYFDGFELKKNLAGNYQLVKIETDRVIPDCFIH